jgi:hypothetical protein
VTAVTRRARAPGQERWPKIAFTDVKDYQKAAA